MADFNWRDAKVKRGDWVKVKMCDDHAYTEWRGVIVSGNIDWECDGVFQVDQRDKSGTAYYTFDATTAILLAHRPTERKPEPNLSWSSVNGGKGVQVGDWIWAQLSSTGEHVSGYVIRRPTRFLWCGPKYWMLVGGAMCFQSDTLLEHRPKEKT